MALLAPIAFAGALPYPETKRSSVVDSYHGTEVADPYRWLEDDASAETAAWVEAQNRVTFAFLEAIPERASIRERLRTLWNYERLGLPSKEGGRYFYSRNSGLQNQPVLLVADGLMAAPRTLLDPNVLSEDGTVALSGWSVSRDGRYLAYGLQRSGADWIEWRVREVETGRDLDDIVEWSKFSGVSWAADGSGFYYSRFRAPREGDERKAVVENHKLYFHKLGTSQDEDTLVYERPDQKQWGFHGYVTEDGRWLVIVVTRGTETKKGMFYKDLGKLGSPVIELLNDFDADYSFVGNRGSVFYLETDLDAPMRKVIAIDVDRPERDQWRVVVPEREELLQEVSLVGGRFVCSYLRHACSAVRIHRVAEGMAEADFERDLELPGIGSAYGFRGKADDEETFFVYTSFSTPATVYRADVARGDVAEFHKPRVAFDSGQFETRQVFAASKDGTRVPMFITHRRGLKLDGQRPVLMHGYGGFNVSLTPGFQVRNVVWLERGGVFVETNLRGGGEYGALWHLAGTKTNKQNTFDDFIACAEWLIANGYTSPRRLAMTGGSNGGLLVGAVMTQRPELFGAALPSVGVMDMLRFHRFTIGWAWTSDYGSAEDERQFRYLLGYSPYHRLRPGVRYPATLITTADHDDRVVPAHSFKFAARLQECQVSDGPPVLIRIETKAGHGAGTALAKVIDETADELSFLVKALALEPGEQGVWEER
jgi:prolyl oligopeptidase